MQLDVKSRLLKWIVVFLGTILIMTLLPKCETSENVILKIHKRKVEMINGNKADSAIMIDGDKYFLITKKVYQEYYPLTDTVPRDLISYEYYLLNADTNEKMYPHKNMYVLTKEGLKKTDRVPEFNLASDAVKYNNSVYHLIDMPTNEPLTDCRVFNWYDDKAAEKGKNPYPDEYTYIARFNKKNNRFIIDSTAVYVWSERDKDQKQKFDNWQSGKAESTNYRSFLIDHMKKFDCN